MSRFSRAYAGMELLDGMDRRYLDRVDAGILDLESASDCLLGQGFGPEALADPRSAVTSLTGFWYARERFDWDDDFCIAHGFLADAEDDADAEASTEGDWTGAELLELEWRQLLFQRQYA